jgi:hypothetical protein
MSFGYRKRLYDDFVLGIQERIHKRKVMGTGSLHLSIQIDGMGHRPQRIVKRLTAYGFASPKIDGTIPALTQIIVATKP